MKKLAMIFACGLLVAACGSQDGKGADAQSADSTQNASALAAKVVDITIKDGKVTPQGQRVEVRVGQLVTLRVSTDSADEVHVHSEPEHEYEVVPGRVKEYTFKLRTPGQVAVESHHLEVTIVQLVVRP